MPSAGARRGGPMVRPFFIGRAAFGFGGIGRGIETIAQHIPVAN